MIEDKTFFDDRPPRACTAWAKKNKSLSIHAMGGRNRERKPSIFFLLTRVGRSSKRLVFDHLFSRCSRTGERKKAIQLGFYQDGGYSKRKTGRVPCETRNFKLKPFQYWSDVHQILALRWNSSCPLSSWTAAILVEFRFRNSSYSLHCTSNLVARSSGTTSLSEGCILHIGHKLEIPGSCPMSSRGQLLRVDSSDFRLHALFYVSVSRFTKIWVG